MNNLEFINKLFELPSKEFKNHIEAENNHRVLFSGKFGIGKTYFLNHFFKDEVQKKLFGRVRYNTFHIYPVNYSIASNEDIFRYVKYDLITLILEKGIQVQDQDLDFLNIIPTFLMSNPQKAFATLVYFIPKVGKDIFEVYEKIKVLKDEFDEYYKKNSLSEGTQLINYMEKVEADEGSIYESGVLTKLISKILSRLKSEVNPETSAKGNGVENILIIDDLDRVDPEHIFRLLNVFAAHFDNPHDLPNKLGFDKVILVCDVNNIKNIFKAKFGVETDFNGYIDKFYSNNIFHLDNRKTLKSISIQTFKSVTSQYAADLIDSFLQQDDYVGKRLAIELLENFIYNGMINLRTLINKSTHKIDVDPNKLVDFGRGAKTIQSNKLMLLFFCILKGIMGGYSDIKEALNKIPEQVLVLTYLQEYCLDLIYFVEAVEHKFKNEPITIKIDLTEKHLTYEIVEVESDSKVVSKIYSEKDGKKSTYYCNKEDFFLLMNKFLEILKRVGN